MADILVVEDEEDLRELLAIHLEGEGHKVIEAKNGKEALDLYPSINPDIVISDINMPIMDGYQLISKLQESYPDFEDTPFFFLSALSDSQDQVKGLSLGIDEYLCKPVDYNVLTVRLNLALQRKEKIKNRINDALVSSKSAKDENNSPLIASESSNRSRSAGSTRLNLLKSKKPKLSSQEQEEILSFSKLEHLHSAEIINRIGRKVKISRLSVSQDNCSSIAKIINSSKFDVEFFLQVNDRFFQSANNLFENNRFCGDKAVIIPSFFQYLYHSEIMKEYIKNLDDLQSKYNISIISEIINLPEKDSLYIDVLKVLSKRDQIQVVEIGNIKQINCINIKSLCIGAVSMDYRFAIKQGRDELNKLRRAMDNFDVNFYIKDIPEGGIIAAQSLKADLLSSFV